jgi:6-pyruvoyltetrahydropterin/6-carboxytetrahydropterin synthase
MSPSHNAPIYTVAVERDFIGRHWLFGGDWGAENEIHSHHYKVEVQLESTELDRHGYLVDIVDIEAGLDEIIAHYRDRTLNELPEFKDLNPSIERLSKLFCEALSERIHAPNISAVTVKIWENQIAWASYRKERH